MIDVAQASQDRGRAAFYPSAGRGWLLVAVMMLANIFSFVDRQIVALLVDPIKHSFAISDFQVSLLVGPAFALFFAIMGLPIGRMIDVRPRLRLAAGGVMVWSLMTGLSGLASSFGLLFTGRIGVGVGEAVMFPAANSLIADSFPPERRARPLGVYSMAIYVGSGLALVFGGAVIGLAENRAVVAALPFGLAGLAPWRLVLVAVGAPGVLVAAALLRLREPERRERLLSAGRRDTLPAAQVVGYLRARAHVFGAHWVCFTMFSLCGYAMIAWGPTYLTRSLGMSRAAVGLWLGLGSMAGGVGGIAGASWLADRLRAAGVVDGKFLLGAGYAVLGAVLALAIFKVTDARSYILLSTAVTFCASAGIGIAPAALQEITPNEMRGQASAVYQIFANLLGAGLGAPLVTLVSHNLLHDDRALGSAIAIVCTGALTLGGIGFLLGRGVFGWEVRRLQQRTV